MRRLTCLWIACWACTPRVTRPTPTPTPATQAVEAVQAVVEAAHRPAIAFGTEPDGALALTVGSADATPAALAATPLSEPETAALLARLEPLQAIDSAHAPTLRPPSAMPPSPGAPTPIAFAAPIGAAVADRPLPPTPAQVAPLAPPQISPAGEVPAEGEIRVRFAEPMVAVAGVGVARQAVATIAPPIAGTWRWLDTSVAQFAPAAARLPQATDITVTVPAGTRSLGGAVLAQPAVGTFATPPVELLGTYPNGAVRPDAPIALQVNQDVDPAALAAFLKLTDKRTAIPFTLISLADAKLRWARHPHFTFDAAALGPHVVIVAPQTAWPSDREIDVALAKAAPSLEGPRRSRRVSTVMFRVAPRFELHGIACDDRARMRTTCPARAWTNVELTNNVEISSYRAELFQLAGQPFADHSLSGATVSLGILPPEVGATYTLKIGDGLVDEYGQPYTGPHELTFATTRAHWNPVLLAETGLYVLDPRYQTPQWTVTADAVPAIHVELYAVQPADYFAFTQLEAGTRKVPPGKRVFEHEYPIGARFTGEARVDLRPALGAGGTGHVLAIATAGAQPRELAWIEVTRLGVVARVDGEQASAWVSDIAPATFLAPTAAVQARLLVDGAAAVPAPIDTDAAGHVALELPAPPPAPLAPKRIALLAVATPSDSAFVPIDRDRRSIRTRSAEWYVADDRFTYKPGEPLYVKGWVRWTHDGVNPGIELPAAGDTVAYTVADARGVELAKGTAALTAQGGFDFQAALPATANLGTARIALATRDQHFVHPFAIEEFRTPAYAVALDDDVLGGGALPLVVGESIQMRAEAHYYGGGGLGGAAIGWTAKLRAASYRPIGFDGFDFSPEQRHGERSTSAQAAARLGAGSSATVQLGIGALPMGVPSLLEVDATVTDIDRSTIRASSRAIVVHPASYYVGLRMAPESLDTLDVVVADLDSHAVAGVPVDIELDGVLASEYYREDAHVKDTQHCRATSAAAPVPCSFHIANDELVYTATARVADPRGRTNAAQIRVPHWRREADHEELAISRDRVAYRAGDVAKLTVFSDVVPSRAIVSYTRQGLISQRAIELAAPKTVVDVPIDVGYLEDVHVVVDRFARRRVLIDPKASAAPLPEHVQAEVDLPIDKRGSELAVRARPSQPVVGPGEPATFDVTVERGGKPVAGAEVALMVVDEAVLALSGAHHADPLEPFYREVEDGTDIASSFELVRDAGADLLESPGFHRFSLDDSPGHSAGTGSGYGYGSGHGGMAGAATGATSAMLESRKDFRATAVWAPKLLTDAQGRARVTVTMPDSLTRFRIVALAAKDAYYFGKVEDAIVTRREVNARTVAPRFLTQGDAFALPVVVQNLDAKARTIDVAVRAANLVADGPAGQRVTIPAGQRAEVRFRFHTRARGRAAIQTAVRSGDRTDASTIELPVYEPATTESFATYGTIDAGPAFERLDVPADIFADVGGVETEIASTQLQALTDAYWYLQAYPYECAEQRSSRMLATTAMADVIDAFAIPGRPGRDELAEQRRKDVAKLVADQRKDGTWGYWIDTPADPLVTMQVMQALAGEPSAAGAVARARANVGALVAKTIARLAARPDARDHQAVAYDVAVAAAALAALAATGVDERAAAQRLHAIAMRLGAYPVDAKAHLLAIVAKQPAAAAMRAELVRELLNATHETAAGATVAVAYEESERLLLPSSNRTTALVLDALIREAPEHALIVKLARGLLATRRGGRWRSTQENLAVLQAMRRYFDVYEKTPPSFTGKLWIGDAAYAEQPFIGRTNARGDAALDWTALAPGSHHDIAIAKTGPGRMYYRIGITYAPRQATVAALDAGFVVRRAYEAVDDPDDVVKTAGGWTIRLGARVQVVLETLVTARRDDVAFVDPLPAGFEAVNTHLATAERAATDATGPEWNHVELRDNRAEAFATALAAGTHRFTYTVRATTPGTFLAAPTKAEEMYSPETFGRSASETVTIR